VAAIEAGGGKPVNKLLLAQVRASLAGVSEVAVEFPYYVVPLVRSP
jgi:hypothetical protein